ncbi:MAG: PilZ domain-containing protein [Candidatus Omnitrophica bacterium]|nr:PilZ domain-containing protein [Candidatus Omnitrophota bacterium]
MGNERRHARRIAVKVDTTGTKGRVGREEGVQGYFVKTYDLSRGGLFMKTDKRYKVGQRVEISIFLSPNESPAKIKGRVAWIASKKKHPSRYPGVGLEISHVEKNDKKRISAFMHKRAKGMKEAKELKNMYLQLKEMAARLVDLEEKHADATHFKTAIKSAIAEIDNVAHLLDREAVEVKSL